MSSVSSVGGSSAYALSEANQASTDLDQDDFLKLMTVQMQSQNPLEPTDNAEFFSQIAQFSQVSGIEELNSAFAALASQLSANETLQAASLVGRDVMVASGTGTLQDGTLSGAVEAPASGRVRLEILNSAGALVRSIDLGDQPAGMVDFQWDGRSDAGTPAADGDYTLVATVGRGDETVTAMPYVRSNVSSVSFEDEGLTIQLSGGGEVLFSNVRQIL